MERRGTHLAIVVLGVVLPICFGRSAALRAWAQSSEAEETIRVNVELVQMNVAVTDANGAYVSGLGPNDFQVLEDGIPEQLAAFEEGNQTRQVLLPPQPAVGAKKDGAAPKKNPEASSAGASTGSTGIDLRSLPPAPAAVENDPAANETPLGSGVFMLFDSSDYMYRDFSSAQDAMADFVHSLDPLDRVAFYSYSRNLSRKVALTDDRLQILRGVHSAVAGDDDALFSSMLLMLQEAGHAKGKKVLVVFSHGPDNASSISPEEVSELAQSEGVPVYLVSTGKAQLDPVSRIVFQRLAGNTGGQVYFAGTKEEEQRAFASIREDLAHLYTLSYYPRANPNTGWRTITVKLKGADRNGLTIRTRSGYRPKTADAVEDIDLPAPN